MGVSSRASAAKSRRGRNVHRGVEVLGKSRRKSDGRQEILVCCVMRTIL
jgi:hypothetical protein